MEGIFTGKITDYGITETKAGLPQVTVSFQALVPATETEPEHKKSVTWYGSLKEGRAQEITIDALITMGYTSKSFTEISGGEGLNKDDEYSLTISTGPNNEGKTVTTVNWINPLGGGAMKNNLAKEDAVKKIKGMNLDAALAMRMNEKGVKAAPKKLETPGFQESDINF